MEKSSDVRRVREQREPLYVEVKEAILELARTQCGPDRRLPSEEELCRLLGVSRATVREALSILCREGFVSKRHGIGNLVNRSVLDTPMRFDLERGLRRMLEDAGYQATTIREMPVSPGGKDILLDDPTLPVRLTIPRPWKIQRTAHLVEGAQAIVTCNVFTSNGSWNGKGFAREGIVGRGVHQHTTPSEGFMRGSMTSLTACATRLLSMTIAPVISTMSISRL